MEIVLDQLEAQFVRNTKNMTFTGCSMDAETGAVEAALSNLKTITTAQAIREAFTHFGIKKLVLISPYVKQTNEHEVHYLTETGFTVLHELGLGLESDGYSAVTPEEWIKIVKENTRPDADGYFLSCTNTRMIEAINDLEQDLGKPVISSNQATLWACLKKLGIAHTNKALGRLFQQN